MKFNLGLVFGLILSGLAGALLAQTYGERFIKIDLSGGSAVIDTLGLDAARSFSVSSATLRGMGVLTLYVALTGDANNSVTLISLTCHGRRKSATTDYTLQTIETALGVGTSYDASWQLNPATTTDYWVWRVGIDGVDDINCTFTPTGGEAADKLTVHAQASAK